MNNILFFLTPKAMCSYLYDDYTMRQALEKMEATGFAALPILNRRGEYRGTLTEGDLLWGIKNMCYMDMRQAEDYGDLPPEGQCPRPGHHLHARSGGAGLPSEFCPGGGRQECFHRYHHPPGHHPVLPADSVPRRLSYIKTRRGQPGRGGLL